MNLFFLESCLKKIVVRHIIVSIDIIITPRLCDPFNHTITAVNGFHRITGNMNCRFVDN